MNEIWLNIPNFPDEYEVSSDGRVRCTGGFYCSTYHGRPVIRKKKTGIYKKKLFRSEKIKFSEFCLQKIQKKNLSILIWENLRNISFSQPLDREWL